MFQESVILANALEKVGYQIEQEEDFSDLISMTLLTLLFDSVLRRFCNEPMYEKNAPSRTSVSDLITNT